MAVVALCVCGWCGCGTTRTSGTARTGTEQLLISDAIDRTVQAIDFSVFRGEAVFFDERHLLETVDKGYLISSFRQHLLASGCTLKETKDQATFVIEPRVGAVGTDNHDLLFGIPAVNVPQVALAPALPAAIPEIPFAKKRDQQGVAKLGVFAYRRETGEPVWQSGIVEHRSTANDVWVLGAGPFHRGTIYDGTRFAGKVTKEELEGVGGRSPVAKLEDQAVFAGAPGIKPAATPAKADGQVIQASATAPASAAAEKAPAAADPIIPSTANAAAGPPVIAPPRPLSEAPEDAG